MSYYKQTSIPQKFWKIIRLYVLSAQAAFRARRSFKPQGSSVLHVISEADRIGGLELQGLELARSLTECGDFVTIFTDISGTLPQKEFRNGFLIHRLPFRNRPGKLRLVFSTVLFLIRYGGRYDVVHVHGVTGFTLLAIRIGRLMRRPTLLIAQTKDDFRSIFSRNDLKHRIYQRWLLSIDDYIAISNELRNEMKDCGVPDSRIYKIPNFVNLARFKPATAEVRAALRSKFSVPNGQVVFLFLGRLVQRKGADVLLNAWRELPGVLWIVGDGPERQSLEQQARDLNLKHVFFHGKTSTPLDFFQAADVFVLPSRIEGLPCVTLEAMSCGLPCIASSIGGVVEQIAHEKQGLLVPPDRPAALAQAIGRMVDDQPSRAQWGKQALEMVREKYDLLIAAKRYHRIYSDLVKGERPCDQ
jgi:glycosyltransferase involved in cell wall biosynthesis